MAQQPAPHEQAADEATIQGWMTALEGQFGDRLDDTARASIREQFAQMVANSRALAAYTLANAQEPAFVFTALREG